MSRSGSRRVIFSPDIHEKPTILLRSGTAGRSAAPYQGRVSSSTCAYRLCKKAGYLPVRLFRYVGVHVVRALCFVSCTGAASVKVSPKTFSRRFAPPQESHQAEAIEDCIKFINSSSRKSC